MDCSLQGSSAHGTLQARLLEWFAVSFLGKGIFLTQESNPDLLLYSQILYQLSYEGLVLNYINCKEFYLLIKAFKEEKSHILLIVIYS